MRAFRFFLPLTVLALALAACAASPSPSRGPELLVSAAANLQPAFTEIAAQFEAESGTHVTLNFAATGTLAQQIVQAAPVDVLFSADRSTVDDLAGRGFVIPDTVQVYARGQIVLYARRDAAVALRSLADLADARVKRIAIANPERAPYGEAARAALEKANLWNALQPKIIFAENIQQTFQYADTGNVDVAIVARSLVISATGQVVPVPQDLYPPIDQALGIVRGTPHETQARAFAAFVTGAKGRAVLTRYGYE